MDKFAAGYGIPDEDLYVVDGEHMGGPTRFMNHSCEPNCCQFTVSYNNGDPKVYDLAFFAKHDIQANTELTFDYKDTEESEEMEDREPEEGMAECLCGAEKCRKYLWA
jgi:histone-lysine N-methyltransferase SUV39H